MQLLFHLVYVEW